MRVKICCIKNLKEAELAIAAGATEIGLVGPMPSGPGTITNEEIKLISDHFNNTINTVVLSSEKEAQSLIAHIKKAGSRSAQIVREIPLTSLEEVKNRLPDITVFQVVHVENESAIERAFNYSKFADVILLDSGKPSRAILGGTGNVHDWWISTQIVRSITIPVFLAGGLNPGNVHSAITAVRPMGVDLCSGIRTEGNLDPDKMQDFFSKLPTNE